MLTKAQFIGPWAGLPVAWNDDYSFDEKTYRGDVARCCEAGVPGVYTCGTTGEFYALEFEEFTAVTDAVIAECKNAGTPVMIGCTSTHTLGVIRRARYAQAKGADAIQIALPFWLEVPDDEVAPFFEAVSRAVPGMPISIYESTRSKKAIPVELHRQIHDAVPAVVCVKCTGATVGCTKEGCAALSQLYHVFVGESQLSELGPYGAIGCCSSLIYQNPRIILGMFDMVYAKRWADLQPVTDKVSLMISVGLAPYVAKGCEDSALDRLLGRSAGFLRAGLRCRPPYPSSTEADLEQFRGWLRANLPEFLEL